MQHQAPDTYQYKTVPFQSSALTENQLNELGSQGWLLVATLPHLVFVRRASPAPMVTRLDDPLLLSIKQVAERLNMSRTKVYGLIAGGVIASFKVGRLTRVPRQELEIFIRTMRRD